MTPSGLLVTVARPQLVHSAAMRLLVTIGLDEPLAERLRDVLKACVVAYPAVPELYALDGRLRVASARVAGRWLDPDGVVFYSDSDAAREARRALALADVPTFPNVRATLPLDDKVLALVAAVRADGRPAPRRGYLPAGTEIELAGERVLKWGDRHCGEGKARASGATRVTEGTIVEPFLTGRPSGFCSSARRRGSCAMRATTGARTFARGSPRCHPTLRSWRARGGRPPRSG